MACLRFRDSTVRWVGLPLWIPSLLLFFLTFYAYRNQHRSTVAFPVIRVSDNDH